MVLEYMKIEILWSFFLFDNSIEYLVSNNMGPIYPNNGAMEYSSTPNTGVAYTYIVLSTSSIDNW